MALSCIISEIKRYIGQKSRFFHTPTFDALVRGARRNNAVTFSTEKLEWCGYQSVKKFDDIFSRFNTIPACVGQIGGHSDGHLATA